MQASFAVVQYVLFAVDDVCTTRAYFILLLFVAEIRDWEVSLRSIQQVVSEWIQIQQGWLALEAIFSTEEIVMQMPKEANMFRVSNG